MCENANMKAHTDKTQFGNRMLFGNVTRFCGVFYFPKANEFYPVIIFLRIS